MCKLQIKSLSRFQRMRNMEKRISEVILTKNVSYLGAKKFIENSLATPTNANIAKPTNNSTQNQRMMTHFDMINLIKELKTLLELLRESLTNLTTKSHAEPDPKKNLYPHNNEAEDKKKPKPNKNNKLQASFPSPQNLTISHQKICVTLKAYC